MRGTVPTAEPLSVHSGRGRFSVVDRTGLERAACECYAAINQAFERRRLAP
jgi:hypothetical protein